jgi:hypothetical protein
MIGNVNEKTFVFIDDGSFLPSYSFLSREKQENYFYLRCAKDRAVYSSY